MNKELYTKDDIFNDFTITSILNGKGSVTSKSRSKITVKCNICGREKTVVASTFFKPNGRGSHHKDCGRGLHMKDKRFYDIWENMRH